MSAPNLSDGPQALGMQNTYKLGMNMEPKRYINRLAIGTSVSSGSFVTRVDSPKLTCSKAEEEEEGDGMRAQAPA